MQRVRPGFSACVRVSDRGHRFERRACSHFCSLECRTKAGLGDEAFRAKRARRIAILNQKGGTGKTTTAVNLAAGLAEREQDVLLIDTDAQGNVGVSLGVAGEKSLYHVIVDGVDPSDAAVPERGTLDVITSRRQPRRRRDPARAPAAGGAARAILTKRLNLMAVVARATSTSSSTAARR